MSKTTPSKPQPDQFGDLIDIDKIEVGDRLRALDLEKVDALVESMAHQGQLHPIVTRAVEGGSEFVLVVGLHRLKAAMKLGWTQIRATAHAKMSDDAAVLAEIDENLCRSELSPAGRADHVGRRKAIYERLHPETKHGAAPGKAGGGKAKGAKSASFAKATAKATGRSKRSIEADARRDKFLNKFSKRINKTSLDRGVEMDALCELSEDEQEALVARAEAGEKVSAKAVLAAKKSGAKSAPPAPAAAPEGEKATGSVEVKAAGAAHGEPIEETPDDDAAPAAETPADEAPTTTNGHAANVKPDDDRPLAEKLHYALNDVWSLCQDKNNWPHLGVIEKKQLNTAMKLLRDLRELLPMLATPKSKPAVH